MWNVNVILKQSYIYSQKNNIYSSAQRRKMRNFCGYQRKAVVIIPTNEEYTQRLSTHNTIEGKTSESDLTEMKGTYILTLYLQYKWLCLVGSEIFK